MTFWYLVFAILLTSGVPAQTISHPFSSLAECEATGNAMAPEIVKNAEVRQAAWKCDEVNFDVVDPTPAEPLPPKVPA